MDVLSPTAAGAIVAANYTETQDVGSLIFPDLTVPVAALFAP